MGRSPERVETQARALLARMSLREKVAQMSGGTRVFPGGLEMAWAYNQRPFPAGENSRLGIPPIRFTDGPRGVVVGRATGFPAAIARGASWDVELEERIGDAIGVEARALGANFFAGVCINLLRHPGWGRAQETYGEEPYLLGEMGAALVRGAQRHVMACVKHFAANSIENSRFKVDVRMRPRVLHEVYLPHFRRCIDEGVASVMSAYNKLNGHYCGHNSELLREILKRRWRFDGFVMSDFVFGIRGVDAAEAGMDLEMPFAWRFGRRLRRAVSRGRVSEAAIDDAVLRILRQKLRFASVGETKRYEPEVVACAEHRELARESARRSIVLLKNEAPRGEGEPTLPLHPDLGSLAVIGRLADAPNLGDLGSSRVRPPSVVTPLEGIRAAAGDRLRVDYDDGRSPETAAVLAGKADVAVLVVGLSHRDEGENVFFRGGDRTSLRLRENDERLIRSVAAANPRCVVVLIGGGAIVTEAWRDSVAALLMAWYPGMEGGHAIADILFGRTCPSGRLPCVFPRSESQLPPFDPTADRVEYGLLHGQRWLDARDDRPAFPLGFGLSYTRFEYANLELDRERVGDDESFTARVDVRNTGERAGDEVVQLYFGCETSRVERAPRVLAGFRRVSLQPGQTRRVALEVPARALAYFDEATDAFRIEPTTYRIEVGPCADPRSLLRARLRVRPSRSGGSPDATPNVSS